MRLYNIIDSKVLKSNLLAEKIDRKTISFYRYYIIDNPQEFRDQIYQQWSDLDCFGRIYIAREGINAQMSVPESNLEEFLQSLSKYPIFNQIPLKYAIEDNGKSFSKLTIKVRPNLIADGLDDDAFDVTNFGHHLCSLECCDIKNSSDAEKQFIRLKVNREFGNSRYYRKSFLLAKKT